MIGSTTSRPACDVIRPSEQRYPRAGITTLDLPLAERTTERWIRFGAAVLDQMIERHCRLLSFAPDSIFAFVRWASSDQGTVHSRIDIVRAVAPSEAYSTLPNVAPGGELLLHLHNWPKVRACLMLIDAIESLGVDPCAAAPDYWRYAHNRLVAGYRAHAYSLARHRAWLLRWNLRS